MIVYEPKADKQSHIHIQLDTIKKKHWLDTNDNKILKHIYYVYVLQIDEKNHQGKTKNGGLQLKSQNLGMWNLGTAGNAKSRLTTRPSA